MRQNNNINDVLEAMILLSRYCEPRISHTSMVALIQGRGWEYYVAKNIFMLSDSNICLFFKYCSREKFWIVLVYGNVKIDGEKITGGVHILKEKVNIEFGTLSFLFKDLNKTKKGYQKVIMNAVLSRKSKKMSLSDIYDYFIEKEGYKNDDSRSWKNSVRCNLSQSSLFIKVARGKNEKPGKGNLWTINEKYLCEIENSLKKTLDREINRKNILHLRKEDLLRQKPRFPKKNNKRKIIYDNIKRSKLSPDPTVQKQLEVNTEIPSISSIDENTPYASQEQNGRSYSEHEHNYLGLKFEAHKQKTKEPKRSMSIVSVSNDEFDDFVDGYYNDY